MSELARRVILPLLKELPTGCFLQLTEGPNLGKNTETSTPCRGSHFDPSVPDKIKNALSMYLIN